MSVQKEYRPLLTPGEPSIVGVSGSRKLSESIITITAAQLASMFTTPVAFMPSASIPSNMYLAVDEIMAEFEFGTVQYTGGGAISIEYIGGSTVVHGGNIPASAITVASGKTFTWLPPYNASILVPLATGLQITNATGAFAAGDGILVLRTWYKWVSQR